MNDWKVIATDNFNREYISDWLVKDNITKEEASQIVEEYNSKLNDHSPWYYKAVPEYHKLWIFDPNN